MIPEYLWAKTTANGKPGKSVNSHMCDVRAVAEQILKPYKFLPQGLDVEIISTFAGLHDIGKISPGFQTKCEQWLIAEGLDKHIGVPYEKDHSKVTQYTIQTMLQNAGMKTESANLWAAILGAHHGKLHRQGLTLHPLDCEWLDRREHVTSEFLRGSSLPELIIGDNWEFIWWLAGLVSISDWIGSDEHFFSAEQETTPDDSKINAINAMDSIAFTVPELKKGLSFREIFQSNGNSFDPNDLQMKAVQTIDSGGLYIIEAPMGMGKTEAALWCVYNLMCKGKASGFYFALPTQATSNRIHKRVDDFLKNSFVEKTHSKLIHSGSWLLDHIQVPNIRNTIKDDNESNDIARKAIDWFASPKRGLIAPFGVGTIDQALMGVIAVKHFFIRQFALAGKVVIFDEVHSYDMYTGTLISVLCKRLLSLGCTVILLSATLTKKSKSYFVTTADCQGLEPYPLISGNKIKAVEVEKPEPKTIQVKMKSAVLSLEAALENAGQGASVLWICNTVNNAQKMYDNAVSLNNSGVEIGLLHARFPVFRRLELEEYWLEKLGKNNTKRSGCILFSTQIVEQSVDLDADFMVSELAPTDMLLQRLGRLWRHKRERILGLEPEIWIIAEKSTFEEFKNGTAEKIKKMFGAKASVYSPYVLLRALALWKDIKRIELPNDIRKLLENTYAYNDNEPSGWQDLCGEIEGEEFAKKQTAHFETNVWNLLLDDEEGKAKTRVNSFPTTQLILALQKTGNTLPLLNGNTIALEGDEFSINDARAIAKNIAKVPAYCFKGNSENKRLKLLVRGDWQVGFINADGSINCSFLRACYSLRYDIKKGVEIMKTDQNREVDYEPCD